MPEDLVGGERVDATLLIGVVVGLVPLLLSRSRRHSPIAVTLVALLAAAISALVLSKLSQIVTTGWTYRYFAPMVAALLLASAIGAARARIVGLVVIVLIIAFNFDPGSFAPGHMSNMQDVSGELAPMLHTGDVVAMSQPEQTPLADYYLPAGLKYTTTMGTPADVQTMDWRNALSKLQHTQPASTVNALVASLKTGQQLLFIRPLTEGTQNWDAPWSQLVRRRSAQWGAILQQDVGNGPLTAVARAPHTYQSACCVASSAILYRKAS